MKAVAINGSHRKGQNTAVMLQTVLDELKAGGVETELVELSDYNIKPCLSCNKCLRRPQCSITDDDMSLLADKLLKADAIILGSPVYWANVTGLMKNFMDRTRWLHMTKNFLAGKVGAAVTHAGLRNGGQEVCLQIMEHFLRAQGLYVVDDRDPEKGILTSGAMGTLFDRFDGNNISWKRGVQEDHLAIASCRQLGKNMLQLMKKLA
ncbi:flavodoxin family protein [Calderihabitans maritimus]|uniref:NADPH-dependent FMN reductase n=1 Tax=Calderihabitans maritimus TaxID=1246530 RepID=A0A1Z5HV25_9FIRM|nr:flavodoxin family protein [Calderihabitans maritimus]GAW93354.1 NADPH-dependent FMN reductase [Calderihabitans maritimus]